MELWRLKFHAIQDRTSEVRLSDISWLENARTYVRGYSAGLCGESERVADKEKT